jgi:hypothetical protein
MTDVIWLVLLGQKRTYKGLLYKRGIEQNLGGQFVESDIIFVSSCVVLTCAKYEIIWNIITTFQNQQTL